MKKLLGIVVLVIGLCGITGNVRAKAKKEEERIKKTQVNSGKSFRKLVIIYCVSGTPYPTLSDIILQ